MLHDVNVLDLLTFGSGAFCVMDRDCVDFARLYGLHQAGAFFVTRASTQVWCAEATCVLMTIVKQALHSDASLYTRRQGGFKFQVQHQRLHRQRRRTRLGERVPCAGHRLNTLLLDRD